MFATGIGSLPIALAQHERGTSPRVAAEIVRDSFPRLPHVVELPARRAGADMIGRTAALLSQISDDFALTTVPTGWRLTSRAGLDMERARQFLQQDDDALAEVYADYHGSMKVQICGPLTWSRSVENLSGEPALSDIGFVRDAVRVVPELIAQLSRRMRSLVPGLTQLIVQIDEPALLQVISGGVPTASGYSRVRSISAQQVTTWFSDLVQTTQQADTALWLHNCADEALIDLANVAAFSGTSFDISTITTADVDRLGTAFERGRTLVIGAIGVSDWSLAEGVIASRACERIELLRSRLSIPQDEWARQVVVTPACGLAGATPAQARTVMKAASAAAASLTGDTINPASE